MWPSLIMINLRMRRGNILKKFYQLNFVHKVKISSEYFKCFSSYKKKLSREGVKVLPLKLREGLRDHLLSTYAENSEKLIFLTS